ncbi:hypothetical protein [Limnoglobus roseus]|uniref:Phage head morphogenesis domain-containing protein n=1 Tax=Limnoglobus roseus TaxID=2598579 RepID=A0A5C1AFU0_9BACT|nr:hypothetical protein [Limnoglobus roseus]QEL18299.1 hypothetical protein PX52LOC_05320 [Limnoglobus roseus]
MRPPIPLTVFAEPPDGPAPLDDQFALPGADGAKAVDLLGSVKAAGVDAMARLYRTAVQRLLNDPNPLSATTLLTDDELQELADYIGSALSVGELLGRARVHGLAAKGEGRSAQTFAEGDEVNPFEAFADPVPFLLPRNAVDYFRNLVPTLGIDPARFGPLMDRHAFTMAHAADQVVLGKVQTALSQFLSGERDQVEGTDAVPGFGAERGGEVVERMLNAAGVTPANPQYSEMVYRTNLMDSYHQGVSAELATPEMQAMFPVWQYLGIADGREGEDHAPKFNRYYPTSASFGEVRGPRIFNCRCSSAPVTKGRWAKLQAAGASVESNW